MRKTKTIKIFRICLILAMIGIADTFKNANKYFLQQNFVKATESIKDNADNELKFVYIKPIIKNTIKFADNTVVHINLNNFFNIELIEPNKSLTGFEDKDLMLHNGVASTLSSVEYLVVPKLCEFANFALNLEKDNGLIKICRGNYNKLLPTLKKDISKIDCNESRKIEKVYNEISNLRTKLKENIKVIDCYIYCADTPIKYSEVAININKYLRCWSRVLCALLEAIYMKFPNIVGKENSSSNSEEVEKLKELVKKSKYYCAVKPEDIKKIPVDCYMRGKLFNYITNLKNCLYIINNYQDKNTYVKDEQWYEKLISFSKRFSKNLHKIERNLFLTYPTTNFCISMLNPNVKFSFPYFCERISLRGSGCIEFSFNTSKIDEEFKPFSEERCTLECCKSNYILNYINNTFAIMQYVMSEDFNKFIRSVLIGGNFFNEFDDDFYNVYFKSIFDAIVDKVIEYNSARFLDDINCSLRRYFLNLENIVRSFLNYFKLNKLKGYIVYSDVEHRNLKLENKKSEDEKLKKYSERVISDFELFCYFFNNTGVKEKLIDILKQNLKILQNKYDSEKLPLNDIKTGYLLNNLSLGERINILQHAILKLSEFNKSGYNKYKDVVNSYVKYMENLTKEINKKLVGWDYCEIEKAINIMDEFEEFVSGVNYAVDGGGISHEISFFENFLIENIKAIFGSEFNQNLNKSDLENN